MPTPANDPNPASGVVANESTVPMLPCVAIDETRAFWEMLGFRATYAQVRPYVYLIMVWSGVELHYREPPRGHDSVAEDGGGALVMVDEVAPYHAAFVAAMRAAHGKVLTAGRPRITRLRTGATRFTVVDPSGNSIVVIARNEPLELEYGGDKTLHGLAKALDNARIYREFKNDPTAAYRSLTSALRRHGTEAPIGDRAVTLATLAGLAMELGDDASAAARRSELADLALDPANKERADAVLRETEAIERFNG